SEGRRASVMRSGASPRKEDPGQKGRGLIRRMGEGLGAGGHSTRRCRINAQASPWFPMRKIIFGLSRALRLSSKISQGLSLDNRHARDAPACRKWSLDFVRGITIKNLRRG